MNMNYDSLTEYEKIEVSSIALKYNQIKILEYLASIQSLSFNASIVYNHALFGNYNVLNFLIQNGAQNITIHTLIAAVIGNRVKCVELLLEKHFRSDDHTVIPAIETAILFGHVKCLVVFISTMAAINYRSTFLVDAIYFSGGIEISRLMVRELLDIETSIDASVLTAAILKHDEKILDAITQTIFDNGFLYDTVKLSITALTDIIDNNDYNLIEKFRDLIDFDTSHAGVVYAIQQKRIKCIDYLLSYSPVTNSTSITYSLILFACEENDQVADYMINFVNYDILEHAITDEKMFLLFFNKTKNKPLSWIYRNYYTLYELTKLIDVAVRGNASNKILKTIRKQIKLQNGNI
jgi:hypothetical protein